MRIVVITDLHANLPALQALLQAIRTHDYDALYHTGDAIAIGPQSTVPSLADAFEPVQNE
jgi:predicted phosphodiesterase